MSDVGPGDVIREQWRELWWLDEEYVRTYRGRLTPEEVDRAIRVVAGVFGPNWAAATASHPIYGLLLAKGLLPLDALYRLGADLLAVKGLPRLGPVIQDLQLAVSYESSRLELSIAAHLVRCGHRVEFRPPLPNHREADIAATAQGRSQPVYLEVKRLSDSNAGRTAGHLVHSVSCMMQDLVANSNREALRGRHYEVELDARLADLLGADEEVDSAVVESASRAIRDAVEIACDLCHLNGVIVPSIARIRLGPAGEPGSAVSGHR
jgi:hypothetical protein